MNCQNENTHLRGKKSSQKHVHHIAFIILLHKPEMFAQYCQIIAILHPKTSDFQQEPYERLSIVLHRVWEDLM